MSFGDRIETRSELEAAEMEREGRISDRLAAGSQDERLRRAAQRMLSATERRDIEIDPPDAAEAVVAAEELLRAALSSPVEGTTATEAAVTEAMEDAALFILARSGLTRKGVHQALRDALAAGSQDERLRSALERIAAGSAAAAENAPDPWREIFELAASTARAALSSPVQEGDAR